MKSGTRSKLTLVDRSGHEISAQTDEDATSVEYLADLDEALDEANDASGQSVRSVEKAGQTRLLVFAAVSAGCVAAAIATGSYALWLSRRKIADDALTSVHEILKTCQDRVSQMEQELSHLPSRATASSNSAA